MRRMLGIILVLVITVPLAADDWTGFRGPDRSGISKETGLLKEWPKAGPKLVFQSDKAGAGLAGMAIVKGTIYTMGAFDKDEFAIALDKGEVKWKTKIGPTLLGKTVNTYFLGPNATPTVAGDHIFCVSSKGMLMCLDTAGKEQWKVDLVKDLGGETDKQSGGEDIYGWSFSASPVVDGDVVYVAPGGSKGALAALDKKSGKVTWRSKDLAVIATNMTPTLATIGGVKQLVYTHNKGVAGVSAKDGSLLWEYKRDEVYPDMVCPTPVVLDDLVYVPSGYGAGAEGLKITADNGKFSAKLAFNEKVIGNKQSGVVLLDKHVYGYHEDLSWACAEAATGKVAWGGARPKRGAPKAGGMVVADGKIFLAGGEVGEAGTVALLEASPKEYKELGNFKLPKKSEMRRPQSGMWTYPSLSDGKLYVRDQELIFCYQVK